MDKLGIRATFYDIFGYALPGIISFVLLGIAYIQINDYSIAEAILFIGGLPSIVSLIIFAFAYVCGHMVSTTSSYLIEKRLLPLLCSVKLRQYPGKEKRNIPIPYQSFHDDTIEILNNKCISLFGLSFSETNNRTMVAFVETHFPQVYSTAFMFLSFYGMARNFTLIFFSWSIIELIIAITDQQSFALQLSGLSFILVLISFYEYYRFCRYYVHEIAGGIISFKDQQT